MQLSDQHKVATPANWQPEDDVIVLPPGLCGTAKEGVESPAADMKVLDWLMVLKK
jgi:peroxiredoxin (alkyl hydroperoxide reductase subunit C)